MTRNDTYPSRAKLASGLENGADLDFPLGVGGCVQVDAGDARVGDIVSVGWWISGGGESLYRLWRCQIELHLGFLYGEQEAVIGWGGRCWSVEVPGDFIFGFETRKGIGDGHCALIRIQDETAGGRGVFR